MKNQYILLIILTLVSACVPTQQFREASDKSHKLEGDRDQLMMENEQLSVENTEMRAIMDFSKTDTAWMKKALLYAKRAAEEGEVPVGALVVKDGKTSRCNYS